MSIIIPHAMLLFGDRTADKELKWPWARDWQTIRDEVIGSHMEWIFVSSDQAWGQDGWMWAKLFFALYGLRRSDKQIGLPLRGYPILLHFRKVQLLTMNPYRW